MAENDTCLKRARFSPDDIIIAVMGVTGSGKTAFISSLLGSDDAEVDHGLGFSNTEVRAYSFTYKHTRQVFLIDTPGFNDTQRSNTAVFKDVAFFLSRAYKRSICLAGIIYLHRITLRWMQTPSLSDLSVLKNLCGENAFEHIALVTTRWDDLQGPIGTLEDGVMRERVLLTNPDLWGFMKLRGSKVFRHNSKRESALAIVDTLVKQDSTVILDIQREMVDKHMHLEDTTAGKQLGKELQKAKERFKERLLDIEEEYQRALKVKDDDEVEILVGDRHKYEIRLKQATDDQEDLKWNLDRLEREKQAEISKVIADLRWQEEYLANIRAEQEAEFRLIEAERRRNEDAYH